MKCNRSHAVILVVAVNKAEFGNSQSSGYCIYITITPYLDWYSGLTQKSSSMPTLYASLLCHLEEIVASHEKYFNGYLYATALASIAWSAEDRDVGSLCGTLGGPGSRMFLVHTNYFLGIWRNKWWNLVAKFSHFPAHIVFISTFSSSVCDVNSVGSTLG